LISAPNIMRDQTEEWVRELVDAGCIVATDQIDANGGVVYAMGQFPAGDEGRRLRELFAVNVVEQAKK
jgi:hypothetical protein